jgi:hypothetical protein
VYLIIFGVDVRNRTHSGSGWPSWIKDGGVRTVYEKMS